MSVDNVVNGRDFPWGPCLQLVIGQYILLVVLFMFACLAHGIGLDYPTEYC